MHRWYANVMTSIAITMFMRAHVLKAFWLCFGCCGLFIIISSFSFSFFFVSTPPLLKRFSSTWTHPPCWISSLFGFPVAKYAIGSRWSTNTFAHRHDESNKNQYKYYICGWLVDDGFWQAVAHSNFFFFFLFSSSFCIENIKRRDNFSAIVKCTFAFASGTWFYLKGFLGVFLFSLFVCLVLFFCIVWRFICQWLVSKCTCKSTGAIRIITNVYMRQWCASIGTDDQTVTDG